MAKTSKTQVEQNEIKVLDALEQYSKENSDKIDLIAKSCIIDHNKSQLLVYK